MRNTRPAGSEDGSAPPPPSCADRRRHCATLGPPGPNPARAPAPAAVARLPQALRTGGAGLSPGTALMVPPMLLVVLELLVVLGT